LLGSSTGGLAELLDLNWLIDEGFVVFAGAGEDEAVDGLGGAGRFAFSIPSTEVIT
jgi:hypothetical protein